MLLLTGASGAVGSKLLPAAARVRAAGPLPGPRAAQARRAAGQRADHARRPRRAPTLSDAPGAARRRHGGPPRGDDPRPAAAPRSRSSTGSPRCGCCARRSDAASSDSSSSRRSNAAAHPAHPLLSRQGARRAGRRRVADRLDGLRAVDRLRPRRSLDHPAAPLLVSAGDAGLRRRDGALPADLGARRGRLRGRLRCRAQATGGALRARRARRPSATTRSSDLVSRASGRPRPLLHVPLPLVRRG